MGLRSLVLAVAFSLVSTLVPAAPSGAASPDVVISQVYGGGGNSGAQYQSDFIELFNRGTAPVNVSTWSVQYASSTGTTWQRTNLSGTIQPGRYHLVRQGTGTSCGGSPCGISLPAPDATGSVAMSASAGKVALMSIQTTIPSGTACPPGAVDLVGFGTGTNCSESAPTGTLSNTTAAQRALGGCKDTDANNADFTVVAPTPRNSASPANACPTDSAPTVTGTTPTVNAIGVDVSGSVIVTFSEAVTPSGTWYQIGCSTTGDHAAVVSGGPQTFTLDPVVDFVAAETCTVTVLADRVSDQDAIDPPDKMAANFTWSFTTTDCGAPGTTRISEVQGSGAASPLAGAVVTVEGVVTGDYQGSGQLEGFYMQEEDADADGDAATSEGIFVFTSLPVSAGDVVRVKGTVTEFFSLTELASVSGVEICGQGASVTPAGLALPVAQYEDFERYEGMLVQIAQTLTATETFTLARFGEVRLAANGRLQTPTAVAAPGPDALAVADANRRRSFVLDDGNGQQNIDPTVHPFGGLSAASTLRSGYTVSGLSGIFDYRFGDYRLQPLGGVAFDPAGNPRPAAPATVGGNTRVAAFNVLNYFNGNGLGGGFPTSRGASTPVEFERQRAKVISALSTIDADIVGLMEIENDAAGNSALEDLVSGLNGALGAGTYSFIDTGVIGSDAIRVAIIYKPASVTPAGVWKVLDASTDSRFDSSRNRPSLAQTFERLGTGKRLTVVVNHLKSKGSACAGDPDTGDGQGNCNGTRTAAAEALVDWVASDPTGQGTDDALLIGDMNAYGREDPIMVFRAGGLTDLVAGHVGAGAYSYVFDGAAGYLDHALATASLAWKVRGVTEWHINADEPVALDYNVEFKSSRQVESFYQPGPYRSSDHDPVIVGLYLDGTPPTITGAATTTPDGSAGWYRSPVTIRFTCADEDQLAPGGCPGDAVLAEDGDGQFVTGMATDRSGNAATTTVGPIAIDRTVPVITFAGPASYSVDQTIAITCTATDATSGIAATSCPAVAGGPAYSFLGTNTATATATDVAGNSASASVTFTVRVDAAGLCALTHRHVSSAGVARSLCAKLDAAAAAAARGNDEARAGQLRAYVSEVEAQRGKAVADADATLLISLAGRL